MPNIAYDRPWLALFPNSASGKPTVDGARLFNLNAVRRVDVINSHEIHLVFGEQHVETIIGSGAIQLLATLLDRAILPDGTPFEMGDESPTTASPLNPGLEP